MDNYLKNINNEIMTLDETKNHFSKRNEIFRNELSDVLRKYENRYNIINKVQYFLLIQK
jgi:hypothetical protein